MLAVRPGEIVTRQRLIHELCNGTTFVDFDQGLNFCIRQIRLALDDHAEKPRFIETIPRRGYRFIAETSAPPGLSQAENVLPPNKKFHLALLYGTAALAMWLYSWPI